MERKFSRRIEALDGIWTFIEAFLDAHALSRDLSFDVGLIIEELFTNMVKYSGDGTKDIAIGLDLDARGVIITLTDRDVEPFDPTRLPEVDPERPLADRKPGGLGIHFVRRLADDFSYEYRERTSRITVVKRVEGSHV